MEFNEKLQKLRKEQSLTQEELAEKLFVSRTAISKWESGRGYPSIDSLKVIAKYFQITIDELIGNEEIISLAEQDIKENKKKHTALICGVLDCFITLLFFLPLFGNGDSSGASVTVFSLTGSSASAGIRLTDTSLITATVHTRVVSAEATRSESTILKIWSLRK